MVAHAASFSTAVHGQDGVAHVYATQWDRRGEDVAEGATTCHITMIDKALAWNTCLGTQTCKHGCRGSIGSVLLSRIKLDDWSAAKHRMIGGVVLSRHNLGAMRGHCLPKS